MARRIEITVTKEYTDFVQECLDDPKRCNLAEGLGKPSLIVQLTGPKYTVFVVTMPGPQIGFILEQLKKSGIGSAVGHVVISSIDCLRPKFGKPPPPKVEENNELNDAETGKVKTKKEKPKIDLGFGEFQRARLTTEEIYNNILNGANMSVNTWFNLIGACLIAGGGLTTNTSVFIIAAMLVSPIMGPILGITFGYRIADWNLMKLGIINCVKMTITAFACGVFISLLLGSAGNLYGWPTSVMLVQRSQLFNLIISVVVSGAAGMVLGVSITASGVNPMVGTAISAGLLPPIVNAGMLYYTYLFVIYIYYKIVIECLYIYISVVDAIVVWCVRYCPLVYVCVYVYII